MSTRKQAETGHPYTMRMSLNVLNHLGINLYSNVAAVLSEIVANAWDADASKVNIEINAHTVIIQDDGHGMDRDDVNERFLLVGYRRREHQPVTTPKGRHVFGRKGIGKLSLFSVADTIDVHTAKGKTKDAFRMSVPAIKRAIASKRDYHPTPVNPATDLKNGTRLVITNLRRQTAWSVAPLRRRIARRFSILGNDGSFVVTVNKIPISLEDRGFEKKVQFLWTFGDSSIGTRFTNAVEATHDDGIVHAQSGYKITGWIGAVERSGDLDEGTDEEGRDNNNKITVLAWGKVIQEDMLEDFREGGLYTKYLIGEIRADFLDLDELDDIATSSREKVIQEDPRYGVLKGYLLRQLKNIKQQWSDWRTERSTEKALRNAAVAEWYDSLKHDDLKQYARSLFEKIQAMPVDDEADRRELYKHGILAFERLQMHNSLARIEQLDSIDALNFSSVFATLQEIEGVLYYEIAKERLEVIKMFEKLSDDDAKERAIQDHLYKNLWLLHPSWDRAAVSTQRLEQTVQREFEKITAKLSAAEKKARYDIKYKTAAGTHIIVELKRRKRKVSYPQLLEQLTKYRSALKKCLDQANKGNEHIEVVCVLGTRPDSAGYDTDNPLETISGRVVTYEQLITAALESYEHYLKAHKEVGKLQKLVDRI